MALWPVLYTLGGAAVVLTSADEAGKLFLLTWKVPASYWNQVSTFSVAVRQLYLKYHCECPLRCQGVLSSQDCRTFCTTNSSSLVFSRSLATKRKVVILRVCRRSCLRLELPRFFGYRQAKPFFWPLLIPISDHCHQCLPIYTIRRSNLKFIGVWLWVCEA